MSNGASQMPTAPASHARWSLKARWTVLAAVLGGVLAALGLLFGDHLLRPHYTGAMTWVGLVYGVVFSLIGAAMYVVGTRIGNRRLLVRGGATVAIGAVVGLLALSVFSTMGPRSATRMQLAQARQMLDHHQVATVFVYPQIATSPVVFETTGGKFFYTKKTLRTIAPTRTHPYDVHIPHPAVVRSFDQLPGGVYTAGGMKGVADVTFALAILWVVINPLIEDESTARRLCSTPPPLLEAGGARGCRGQVTGTR